MEGGAGAAETGTSEGSACASGKVAVGRGCASCVGAVSPAEEACSILKRCSIFKISSAFSSCWGGDTGVTAANSFRSCSRNWAAPGEARTAGSPLAGSKDPVG